MPKNQKPLAPKTQAAVDEFAKKLAELLLEEGVELDELVRIDERVLPLVRRIGSKALEEVAKKKVESTVKQNEELGLKVHRSKMIEFEYIFGAQPRVPHAQFPTLCTNLSPPDYSAFRNQQIAHRREPMSDSMKLVGSVVACITFFTCSGGAQKTQPLEWAGTAPDPCTARNPIALLGPLMFAAEAEDEGGEDQHGSEEHHQPPLTHAFDLPVAADVCLVVDRAGRGDAELELVIDGVLQVELEWDAEAAPHGDDDGPDSDNGDGGDGHNEVDGHGDDAEGDSDSDSPEDREAITTPSFRRPFRLSAGRHTVSILERELEADASVVVRVEVAGPVIDSVTPIYGPPGTPIVVQGEGFVTPFTIRAGDVALSPVGAGSESTPGLAIALTAPDMPIGRLTITTPLGSATSVGVFTPLSPRGVVPFYPGADFAASDLGSCVQPSRLRVVQDGDRVSFVVDFQRPLPADVAVHVDIDDDAQPSTIEFPLMLRRQGPRLIRDREGERG